jgi:NAD(P)-dependent dehydrogenase (short-subunit alcohol dehydrogenase family)
MWSAWPAGQKPLELAGRSRWPPHAVGRCGDRRALAGIVEEIASRSDRLTSSMHAAGINTREQADDVTPEGWDAHDDAQSVRAVLPEPGLCSCHERKGWGRIVNFASLQTTRAFPGGIAYGASKGGIGQLTRAMAEAWSKDGITANAIGPGFFPTELTGPVFCRPERAPGAMRRRPASGATGLGRHRRPALFLCSPASDYVTGQILMVDGGFTAK